MRSVKEWVRVWEQRAAAAQRRGVRAGAMRRTSGKGSGHAGASGCAGISIARNKGSNKLTIEDERGGGSQRQQQRTDLWAAKVMMRRLST